MSIIDIETSEQFDQILRTTDKVVVDFNAEWCGPCKALKPVLEQLAKTHTRLTVCALDVEQDDCASVVKKYQIQSLPTLLFFYKGVAVKKIVGANTSAIQTAMTDFEAK